MATIEYSTKAESLRVLPILVIANFLDEQKLLALITQTQHETAILDGGAAIRLTLQNGDTFADMAAMDYVMQVAIQNVNPGSVSVVSVHCLRISSLMTS